MDFNYVTSRLAVGSAIDTEADIQTLLTAGFTHIVNLREEHDEATLIAGRLSYLWNGEPDDGKPKPVDWFQKAFAFVLPLFSLPHPKVLIHCAAGISRGPSMTYAVLRCWGFLPGVAEKLITDARRGAWLTYQSSADQAVKDLGYASG